MSCSNFYRSYRAVAEEADELIYLLLHITVFLCSLFLHYIHWLLLIVLQFEIENNISDPHHSYASPCTVKINLNSHYRSVSQLHKQRYLNAK